MKVFCTILIWLLVIGSEVKSVPIRSEELIKKHHIKKTFRGRATWFLPDTGACGDVNSVHDYIIALNAAQVTHVCLV